MKWSLKQLRVCLSVFLSFVLMHWTLLDSRSSRLQEAASWVAVIASALLQRYVLDERWDFPFGNQRLVLPSTSISFPFSLWFLCPLSSCTTHLFLPRICVYLLLCTLDSVPTLMSIWSGEVAGTLLCVSAYPGGSIVCYFLCIKAVLYLSPCASAICSDVGE